jgi:hypothetical protein
MLAWSMNSEYRKIAWLENQILEDSVSVYSNLNIY